MLELIGIKTKEGYYIMTAGWKSSYQQSELLNYTINGKKPKQTFHPHWVFVDDDIKSITSEAYVAPTDRKYTLKDKSLSDKFKLEYNAEEVWDGDDYINEFSSIRGLYVYSEIKHPPRIVNIRFTLDVIKEVDDIKEEVFFFNAGNNRKITKDSIEYSILSAITEPSILIESNPCRLSSKDSYAIVRAYIKENINHSVAVITSDYDFCFTVKKRIALHQPFEDVIERYVSPRKKKKEKIFIKTREVEVFEMTWSPENYSKYTPIQSFEGKNVADLRNNIENYLTNLIKMINEPLVDCPTCKGLGVVLNEQL